MDDKLTKIASLLRKRLPDDIEYAMWKLQNNIEETPDYDMRGFFDALVQGDKSAISEINPNDKSMHFPDKWKTPTHKTFSTDSKYYDPLTMGNTPEWLGGQIPGGGESWTLRRPNGEIVSAEAPWYVGGLKK